MDGGLSMSSRAEITSKYAGSYLKAGKKDKGRILDQVVEVTGWSRDNARRRLMQVWHSPETVEASAIRGSDVRETEEVRPGVP